MLLPRSSLGEMPVLRPQARGGRAGQAAPSDPHPGLRVVPSVDSRLGRVRAAALVGRPLVALNPIPEEGSLNMIAAATRYLYRCRRAGDKRPAGDLLRDLVSEADAGKLETAVSAFFDAERLS
jgi:hypothetical protein